MKISLTKLSEVLGRIESVPVYVDFYNTAVAFPRIECSGTSLDRTYCFDLASDNTESLVLTIPIK